jgi:hypothetical protein
MRLTALVISGSLLAALAAAPAPAAEVGRDRRELRRTRRP